MYENHDYLIRQAVNGWILVQRNHIGSLSNEFVFASLDEMNDWLKAKHEHETANG